MATKKSSAKTSAKRPAAKSKTTAPLLERILDAGLSEAAAVGWRHVTMDAIAAKTGADLGEVLMLVPSKTHFVMRLLDRIDGLTVAGVKSVEGDETPRDRLFEIMMRRFDALNAQREGCKSVIAAVSRDPAAAPLALCRVHRSLALMLAAAGISTDGLLGAVRIKGLGVVGAFALRAWMADDSADLSKTMAALDRALNKAERLAGFASRRGRKPQD